MSKQATMVKTERDPVTGTYRALVRIGRGPWMVGATSQPDWRAASQAARDAMRDGRLKPLTEAR